MTFMFCETTGGNLSEMIMQVLEFPDLHNKWAQCLRYIKSRPRPERERDSHWNSNYFESSTNQEIVADLIVKYILHSGDVITYHNHTFEDWFGSDVTTFFKSLDVESLKTLFTSIATHVWSGESCVVRNVVSDSFSRGI